MFYLNECRLQCFACTSINTALSFLHPKTQRTLDYKKARNTLGYNLIKILRFTYVNLESRAGLVYLDPRGIVFQLRNAASVYAMWKGYRA